MIIEVRWIYWLMQLWLLTSTAAFASLIKLPQPWGYIASAIVGLFNGALIQRDVQ